MIDYDDWEQRIPQLNAARDADQVEKRAIELGTVNIEEGIRDQLLAGAMDDFAQALEGSWAEDDATIEDGTGQTANELSRRADILGEFYPFQLNGNHLAYSRSSTLIYEFCLAVSTASTITEGRFVRLPRAFERLCRDVASVYLGVGAEAYRTGYPADVGEGRPCRMKAVASELNAQTGEWVWQPRNGMPENPAPRDAKDLGMDVVAWKKFQDGRRGHLFLVGQCACGHTDWRGKFGQLDLGALDRNWFRPLSLAGAHRFFAVPFHIPNTMHLEEITIAAGLTFDRCRITLIAESDPERISENTFDNYTNLIQLVIDGFEAA